MGKRIKELRKHLGLTQQEFADKLGIKRGAVANYEIGRNEPIDAVVALMCREFRVNEEWVRTGNGDMYIQTTQTQKLAEFMADVMNDAPDSARIILVSFLANLDTEDWEDIDRIVRKHLQK